MNKLIHSSHMTKRVCAGVLEVRLYVVRVIDLSGV